MPAWGTVFQNTSFHVVRAMKEEDQDPNWSPFSRLAAKHKHAIYVTTVVCGCLLPPKAQLGN